MKKPVIGYIYSGKKLGDDEIIFRRLAKKKKVELVMFNIFKDIEEKEFEEKLKKCDIIFNNTAVDYAIEIVKSMEELGKKVIDSSSKYYYIEDKWIFFLACKKNKIPTPETILLSEDLNLAEKELNEFNRWPVILKRVEGCSGEFVEKANNIKEALKTIKHLWKKGSERLPIIAQEFIPSSNYRVLLIDGKIVQTTIRKSTHWKATGAWAGDMKKFPIDKNLKKIINKVMEVTKIKVCGIDLMKKGDKWLVLEVNSEPTFGFFDNEREKIINQVLNFLLRSIKKKR